MSSSAFHSHPAPVLDYETALARIQAIQADELATPGFNPELQTILLTHGDKARQAVLWFHGYTSAPLTLKSLAELCFQNGCNVLVPCIPHHGFEDRRSPEVSRVKAVELASFTQGMIDLTRGLGEKAIVGGLSMGGVTTCWAAQERADISTAIIIAPPLGARIIPAGLTRIVAYGAQLLPVSSSGGTLRKRSIVTGLIAAILGIRGIARVRIRNWVLKYLHLVAGGRLQPPGFGWSSTITMRPSIRN
jgi:pimeloyl-ACP methyl ester carboxylesterase